MHCKKDGREIEKQRMQLKWMLRAFIRIPRIESRLRWFSLFLETTKEVKKGSEIKVNQKNTLHPPRQSNSSHE
jgi:hypothetical protein